MNKIDIYINDLLKENRSFLGKIGAYNRYKLPEARKKHLENIELYSMALAQGKTDLATQLLKSVAFSFVRYSALVSMVYYYRDKVNENLEKIKGLRDGTIKEI